jgi:integrase
MKVLFWLRRNRTNKAGTAPVMCRITVKGSTPVQFSTHLMVENWDNVRKKAKGANSQFVNVELTRIANELNEIGRDLERQKIKFTSQSVMDKYSNLACPAQKWTWLQLMQDWHDRMLQQFKAGICAEDTYETTKYRLNSLQTYLKSEKLPDLLIADIKNAHYETLQAFFLNQGKSWNYTKAIMDDLHAQLIWAVNNSLLDKDPWAGLTMTFRINEDSMHWLTAEQVKELETYLPQTKTIERRLDAILFLCWSGLSWGDYDALTSANLIEQEGKLWLDGKRGKTKTPFHVPIFKFTKLGELITKYGSLEALPKYSNSKMNDYIKEIFESLEFENAREYTCHDLRRTFSELCHTHFAYDASTVAMILGHKSTSITFRHYLRMTRETIANRL